MKTVTVPIKGINVAGCAHEIEKSLGKREPIGRVEASYATQTATITFDETKLSEAQLVALVQTCGFACNGPMTESSIQTTHPAKSDGSAGHEAPQSAHVSAMVPQRNRQQPGTMAPPMAAMDMSTPGTKMPETTNDHNTPAEAHPAKHKQGISDGMMDHGNAKGMEADIRWRFFASLILTLPVFLYSPLAVSLLKLQLPTPFHISPNWISLVFATPVVWWAGWIFHSGAWRALRNRTLNMNVLVSLGVLVAYLFSVFVTFFAPQAETSYDAAALLVTIVLFGHWMEMRSRRGSSDALTLMPALPHSNERPVKGVIPFSLLKQHRIATAVLLEIVIVPLGSYALSQVGIYAQDLGLVAWVGTIAVLAASLGNLLGRFLVGIASDYLHVNRMLLVLVILDAVAGILLWRTSTAAVLVIAAGVVGFSCGGLVGTVPRMATDALPAAFNSILGLLFAAFALGGFLGPLLGSTLGNGSRAWFVLSLISSTGIIIIILRLIHANHSLRMDTEQKDAEAIKQPIKA